MNPFVAMARRVPTLAQRTRRLLVLETFTAYPVVVLGYYALVATGRLPSALWAPIAIVLMTGFIGGLLVINGYARNRANPNDQTLDERQHALAVRAWALSYAVLTWFIVLLALAWAVVVTVNGPVTIGPEFLLPVAIGTGVYLPTLPLAMLAWIEPDVPGDDDRQTADR
jgi:hypothetical protein